MFICRSFAFEFCSHLIYADTYFSCGVSPRAERHQVTCQLVKSSVSTVTDNPNHPTYCTAELPYEYKMGTFPLLKLPSVKEQKPPHMKNKVFHKVQAVDVQPQPHFPSEGVDTVATVSPLNSDEASTTDSEVPSCTRSQHVHDTCKLSRSSVCCRE